jgi:hypothetical protein
MNFNKRLAFSILALIGLLAWDCPAAAEAPKAVAPTAKPATASAAFGPEELLRLLARDRPLAVPFEETAVNNLLTAPLHSRGLLSFTPPATLEKRIDAPQQERYLITGDQLLVENKAQQLHQTLSLQDYPTLRAFVEAFRSTLAGDSASLRRYYALDLSGGNWRWILRLQPLDASMREFVSSISFSGEQGHLTSVQIVSPDGNSSKMVIGPWPPEVGAAMRWASG